jgi:hypothetical protein
MFIYKYKERGKKKEREREEKKQQYHYFNHISTAPDPVHSDPASLGSPAEWSGCATST